MACKVPTGPDGGAQVWHLLSQKIVPSSHVHSPPLQVVPSRHTSPLPQTHTPSTHPSAFVSSHGTPQAPQLAGSFFRSLQPLGAQHVSTLWQVTPVTLSQQLPTTHWRLQTIVPGLHVQFPLMHV